jgi:predicted nucleic acid-binding protein
MIGIDTVAFIYHIEAVPAYRDLVGPFFLALERGAFHAVTSVVTLMELAVQPLRLRQPEVADEYEIRLTNFPHLTVLPVDRHIARGAAELRAQYRLRPADSLQMATALLSGATAFVTNDRELTRVPDIDVLILESLRPAT